MLSVSIAHIMYSLRIYIKTLLTIFITISWILDNYYCMRNHADGLLNEVFW